MTLRIPAFLLAAVFLLCACSDKNKDNSTKTAASEQNDEEEDHEVKDDGSTDSDKKDGSKAKKDGEEAKPKEMTEEEKAAAEKAAAEKAAKDAEAAAAIEAARKAEQARKDAQALEKSNAEVDAAVRKAESGDIDGAVADLKRTVVQNPKAALAFYNLGLLYERQSNITDAHSAYSSALTADSGYTPALLQLVRLDIRGGNPESALSNANRYVAQNASVFDHNYAKIEAMIANRQYDATVTLIRNLLKKDEANPRLRYYISMVEFERKHYRLAEFMINESLAIAPSDPDSLFLKARIHHALSTEDISLVPGIATLLDRVIANNPDHLEALWMRGNIYYEASNYAKAEAAFRRVITLNPRVVGAYVNLANTLKAVDRGPEAETLLKKAKEIDPNDGLVDFALGTLYLNTELIHLDMKDMDRLKLARTQFENARDHWKSSEDVALAKAYIRTTDDAIETLQAMLDAEALFGAQKNKK